MGEENSKKDFFCADLLNDTKFQRKPDLLDRSFDTIMQEVMPVAARALLFFADFLYIMGAFH